MKEILHAITDAAKQAGRIVNAAAGDISKLKIEQKSLYDYVSEVDRNAEAAIAAVARARFPHHAIIGEEYGAQGDHQAEYSWVVDPLDGTTNFLRSIPHYAVSIGVIQKQQVVCGVIYDPAKQDLFSAVRGHGAQLNGQAISVSRSKDIKGALLATGVPYSGKNLQQLDRFTGAMTELLAQQTSGIRRLGAAALDLAYVAAGRYEGFWEANLHIWDIAAGALLVQEAGGVVTDLRGESAYLENGNILAANPHVHRDMLAITSQHY